MDERRIQEVLFRSAHARVLVVGDCVLNRRLQIDRARIEYSEETGVLAHQVIAVDHSPGASGSVASALRALGSAVMVLSVIGDDGEGYDLRRYLRQRGIDDRAMIVASDRWTPTSIRPVIASATSILSEQERLDIRSRSPMSSATTTMLIDRLRAFAPQVQAVIVVDHVPEEECGVVTTRLRREIADLADRYRDVWFLAISQRRVGLFRNVIVMPDARECVRAVYANDSSHPPLVLVGQAAEQLRRRTGKPVFVMLGSRGMLVVHDQGMTHAPPIPTTGPIDAAGAGHSAVAAVTAALCAGATLDEAVELGNLATVAAVRPPSAPGMPAPDEIISVWRAYRKSAL